MELNPQTQPVLIEQGSPAAALLFYFATAGG
jgi:hypothetical protein